MLRKYIFISLTVSLLFSACTERSFDPILKVENGATITAPATGASFVLTEEKAEDTFADFSWSPAEYGFDAGVTYSVEMDAADANFGDPVSLGTVNALELKGVTIGEVNNAMLMKSLPDGVPTDVQIRIAADVVEDVPTVYSDPITLAITPYKTAVDYPKLQVPGSYQGWDPGNTETVIYSRESDNTFEGFLYVGDADALHKFTDGPSWDVNWGDTGADGILDLGGDDIVLGAAGFYRFKVDLNDLSYSTTLTNWGVLGTATPNGWDEDQDFIVDPTTGVMSITLDLVAGEMKFRANDEWVIDFGDTNGNGSLEYGGDNIIISEDGNYTIELLLNVSDYTYTITKN
ncbi:MAG: SusE domain-containing protein [Bacteroidota bacterium]